MSVIRFQFQGQVDRESVESDVALAIFAAECVYGRPRVRMEASYLVDGQECLLDVSGESGDTVARVFAGLVSARLGEGSYTVVRVQSPELVR